MPDNEPHLVQDRGYSRYPLCITTSAKAFSTYPAVSPDPHSLVKLVLFGSFLKIKQTFNI